MLRDAIQDSVHFRRWFPDAQATDGKPIKRHLHQGIGTLPPQIQI
jgi:hypothetical protein